LEALCETSIIDLDIDKGYPCLMYPGVSHDVESCPIAEELLQGMISRGQIEICSATKEEGEVCMQSGDKNPSKPKPLVIHFTRDITTQVPRGFHPLIAKTPTPSLTRVIRQYHGNMVYRDPTKGRTHLSYVS